MPLKGGVCGPSGRLTHLKAHTARKRYDLFYSHGQITNQKVPGTFPFPPF